MYKRVVRTLEDEKAIDLGRLSRFNDNLKSNGLPLNDWQANKKYKVNYPVLYENKIYRCIESHTASSTFDETKWETVSNVDSGLKAWTANTSYSVGNIVIYNDKIYKCITGNNDATFKPLNWVCLSATGEEDIGHITFGYELQSGYLPLDGSTYNRADYADLINWVTYNSLWASTSTDYGKFGTGDGTTTFTTPNFTGKFIECDDGTNTGVYTSAGLPNIKGVVDTYTNGTSGIFSISGVSGAFDTVGSLTKMNVYNGADSNDTSGKITLDASRSNSIYSDSVNIVQPESIKLIPQIKYRKPNKSLPVKAVRRTLFEGSAGSSTTTPVISTIQLPDSYRNYDTLGLYLEVTFNTETRIVYREIPTDQLDILINKNDPNWHISLCWGFYNTNDYFDILGQTSTETVLSFGASLSLCKKIVGIKYINENKYSTEEQLVGTWIDGKPLYQKTVEFTTPSESSVQEYSYLPEIPFSSIDKIISVDGWCARNDGWRVPYLFTVGKNVYFAFDWHKSNQKIYFYVFTKSANQSATLTFRYTKTT